MTTIYQYFCIKNKYFWNIFNLSNNFIQIYPKTHQIASFKHIFSGVHAPERPPPPPQQAPCSATRLMPLRGTQLAQIKKNAPP